MSVPPNKTDIRNLFAVHKDGTYSPLLPGGETREFAEALKTNGHRVPYTTMPVEWYLFLYQKFKQMGKIPAKGEDFEIKKWVPEHMSKDQYIIAMNAVADFCELELKDREAAEFHRLLSAKARLL